MTCTKAQILVLIGLIENEVASSRSLGEALERIGRIRERFELMTEAELRRELGLV